MTLVITSKLCRGKMFGQSKVPKSQKPDTTPLYFYQYDDLPTFEEKNKYQIAVIDIGFRNMCLRIETREAYPPRVVPLVFVKTPIPPEENKDGYRVQVDTLIKWLDEHKDLYVSSDIIVIEWQLPQNYKAVRLSSFILTYFHLLLRGLERRPFLIEMRSGFKDDYFPQLKTLNQAARKKETVVIALDLLDLMNDKESLRVFKKNKKVDDYADTVVMAEVIARYLAALGYNIPHWNHTVKISLNKKH